jgi:ubiquitin C-terminal hydrolase
MYRLFGMLHHKGDISSGTYHSVILNLKKNKWTRCEDTIVTELSGLPENNSTTACTFMYYKKDYGREGYDPGRVANPKASMRATML